MDDESLQAEVTALLRSVPIGKAGAARVLDAALDEVYSAVTRKACCPHCKDIFAFAEPTTLFSARLDCRICSAPLVVATGVIKSKRFNVTSMLYEEIGLFLRFKDAANRERYIHVRGSYANVELKSKDVFSLAVGERGSEDGNSSKGKAAVMNLTLMNPPVISFMNNLDLLLESMKTPTN